MIPGFAALAGIADKLLGLFVKRYDRNNRPEARRERAAREIDAAVARLDGDGVNRVLDDNLRRLRDERSDAPSREGGRAGGVGRDVHGDERAGLVRAFGADAGDVARAGAETVAREIQGRAVASAVARFFAAAK